MERWARELGAAAFFVALAVVATWPLAADLRGRTLAGPDPLIDLWTVHWLSGHLGTPSELFGGNIFHPDPNAVLYSDLSLGTAVLVVPLRLVVHDPVPLYNLAVLAALAFGGWAFHLLTWQLTGNRGAGLLAGVLAAFGSHQLSHVYHLNLLSTGWLALLLLALHRLVDQPGPGPVVLAAVSFALAAQSSGYYALAAVLLALLFAAVHWRALAARRVRVAVLAAGFLGSLLLLPYLHAFLGLRQRQGLRRPAGMSERLAFDPGHDLGSRAYVYRPLFGAEGERMFPGFIAPVLAALGLARRTRHAAFYAIAAAGLLLVSLGPQLRVGSWTLPLPYRGLFALPPFDAMRHPFTFAAVATFLLAVMAGLGWAALAVSARVGAAAGIVLLAVLETLGPEPTLRRYPAGLPPVYQALMARPRGPVLEIPVSTPETLLWAARHGWPVVNGVGAFAPQQTQLLDRVVSNHWLKGMPQKIDRSAPTQVLAESFPVRYVVLPVGHRPLVRRLAAAFDRSRVFLFVIQTEDGDRLYEFRRENLPPADSPSLEPDSSGR